MSNNINNADLTEQDYAAIDFIFEPVIENDQIFLKPKYENISDDSWNTGVTALQKVFEIKSLNHEMYGLVYVPAEAQMNRVAKRVADHLMLYHQGQYPAVDEAAPAIPNSQEQSPVVREAAPAIPLGEKWLKALSDYFVVRRFALNNDEPVQAFFKSHDGKTAPFLGEYLLDQLVGKTRLYSNCGVTYYATQPETNVAQFYQLAGDLERYQQNHPVSLDKRLGRHPLFKKWDGNDCQLIR